MGAYFEKLFGCDTINFSNLVIIGGQVEDAIKNGRLSGDSLKAINYKKEKSIWWARLLL